MNSKATRQQENAAMAAKLFEARDAARFLFRDQYAETIESWRDVITAQMAVGQSSVMSAVIVLGQQIHEHDAVPLMCLFAAAVEMIERDDNYDGPEDLEAWAGGISETH